MTMLVVVGRPYVGLAASDTRIVDEHGTFYDNAEVECPDLMGGPTRTIGKTFRKFAPLENGWVGMTGSASWALPAIKALQREGCADIEALCHVVQESVTVPALKLGLTPMFRLAVVLRTANGYESYFVTPTGEVAMNCGVIVTPPPGLAPEMADGFRARLEAEFLPDGYANGLDQALRVVAEVIGEGHQHLGPEGPMSNLVEIGILTPEGHRHIPPTPYADVVAELLRDINPDYVAASSLRKDTVDRCRTGSQALLSGYGYGSQDCRLGRPRCPWTDGRPHWGNCDSKRVALGKR